MANSRAWQLAFIGVFYVRYRAAGSELFTQSKLFVSGTAAAAVIGAIGFAYAQTTPSGTQTNPQTQNQGMTPAQSTTGTPTTPSTPSTSTGSMNSNTPGMSNNTRPGAVGPTTDNTGNMGNERLARADRN